MGRADVYVQPDAPDPVLDEATVRTLARRYVPDAGGLVEVDEAGGEARVYLLGGGVLDGGVDGGIVVKTQRPHRLRPRTSLAKEADLLGRLAASQAADRVPRLYGYGTADTPQGRVEYLCMSRMPGRAVITQAPLDGAARTTMFADLAAILRTVHGLDIRPLVEGGLFPTDAGVDELRRRLESGFGDVSDAHAASGRPWPLPITLADVVASALAALPATVPTPVVLHSNPGRTHAFVDPQTGTLTGLIDFGDSYLSHPAMDLRSWPDPADRQLLHDAYREGQPDDAVFDRVWTIAMIYSDCGVIAAGSPHADAAADDLTARLEHL